MTVRAGLPRLASTFSGSTAAARRGGGLRPLGVARARRLPLCRGRWCPGLPGRPGPGASWLGDRLPVAVPLGFAADADQVVQRAGLAGVEAPPGDVDQARFHQFEVVEV